MTGRPRLLDLFCGAGGAAMGYHRAGFDVVGVDIEPQPNYPFEFWQANALEVLQEDGHWSRFDAIHASPPCQAYSEGGRRYPEKQASHPRLIKPTRELLSATGLPWVMENVIGAKDQLRDPVMICGASVGLTRLQRHRLFETNWTLLVSPCTCRAYPKGNRLGVYGDRPDGRYLNSLYKDGARAPRGLEEAREAMGMDWADWHGTKEAIPPAYTELIGYQLLQHIRAKAAA